MAILLAGILALLLSGCTIAHDAFTNPTGNITIPRAQFIGTYARARQLYIEIRDRAFAACRAGQLPPQQCGELGALDQEAKRLDFEVKAKLAVPETELDWQMIEKVLGFAVKLVL